MYVCVCVCVYTAWCKQNAPRDVQFAGFRVLFGHADKTSNRLRQTSELSFLIVQIVYRSLISFFRLQLNLCLVLSRERICNRTLLNVIKSRSVIRQSDKYIYIFACFGNLN